MLSDTQVIARIFNHIDNKTTDLGESDWYEPVQNYSSQTRFDLEQELLRRLPLPFCPLAALPQIGSYVARTAAGTPLVVVRDNDGEIKAFRNACRHRGKQIAQGAGCTKIFKCGYHGWAYRLDGKLEHIPDQHGFPNLDKSTHGLVPVTVAVKGGIVFVTQQPQLGDGALEQLPELLPANFEIFSSDDSITDINWKLNMEATLEGYHIKSTHGETFYPYGYDNLNVVETVGQNSRITFPFRRIERLRELPQQQWTAERMLTYVYNVFPIATVAQLSNHTVLTISEPISPTSTQFFNYKLGAVDANDSGALERAKKDAAFVADTGLQEDTAVVREIQQGLSSGANTHFTYGRFEKAIVHFHQQLNSNLEKMQSDTE